MSTSSMLLLSAGIVGCGIVSGVCFAFSGFVMPALGRLPAPQGVAAMQAINIAAISPAVMIALFGTTAACLGIAAQAVAGWGASGASLRVAGAALYLIGVVGVTGAANVPRNDALAALDPHSVQAATAWATYLREWTTWNSVRAVAGARAAAAINAAR
ncbi:MAG: DUF1772 domain-containing protein [Thermomicrobiales bacterium]